LRVGLMSAWITTSLLLVPLAGALFIWIVPMPREWAGPFALLVALGELALWIVALTKFDFGGPQRRGEQDTSWFSDLGASYHVGLIPAAVWFVGMTAVVLTA